MSHNKRHGTAESQLRAIPKLPRDTDRTMVDMRPAPPRREGAIPSLVAKPSRPTKEATTPPPNVIPFTKPRAIAALAAANPESVVIKQPSPPPAAPKFFDAPTRVAPAPVQAPANDRTSTWSSASSVRMPYQAPAMPAATRVATGWTPPGAVPIVKPAAPVAQVSQTLYPMPAPARMPAPVMAPLAMPAPVIPVPALHKPIAPVQSIAQPPQAFAPVTTSRPASQMPIAEPIVSTVSEPKSKWAAFEALGLGMPKIDSKKAANLIVSAYRMLGFAILTIIVIVLVGYIANTLFFFVSDSWVVPMAVSPTDEKVVALQAQLAEQQNTRDRIADEYTQAERTIAAQQAFQVEFAKAIKSDLAGRKSALGRIRALANAASSTRRAIKNQSSAYASASRRKMAQEYAAGLIDQSTMLNGKFQIAQISSSNLSLAERQAEFETRAQELEDQTRSLDAILANEAGDDTALSYEVLRIKQEYEASRLDLAKSIEARDTLKASLERQDKIVKSLQGSSYLRAINDNASVAFVPYSNLSSVEKGSSVYACRVGMVFCRNVGEVLDILPGEVQFKHPQRDKVLRGQMVELKVDEEDSDAATDDVLFVGGRPLFI